MNSCIRQKGVALITVLLVVALVSIIAMQMGETLQTQVRRTTAILTLNDAKWVNVGAEGFAMKVLRQDFKDSPNRTHLGQYWAGGEVTFPLENGAMFAGELSDLNGCFNLNALREEPAPGSVNNGGRPRASLQFIALLEQLDIESYQSEIMADSLQDWLDKDDYANHSSGAEDSEYLGRVKPYLAANSGLVEVGELRAINGFTQAMVEKILPYVCVVPGLMTHKLNLNTVEEPEILVAFFQPDMTLAKAEEFISSRPDDGYGDVDGALRATAFVGMNIDPVKPMLAVISDYFVLEAETQLESGITLFTQTILHRKDSDWTVIGRRFGGQGERVPDTKASESS